MACQGPYFSPLLLNAIFFVASKHVASKDGSGLDTSCNGADNCNAGLPFRQLIEDILHHPEARVLCKSSITTVQALLLLSDALFSWCDERSLSWHYLGIAINMIIDLGIHSENSTLILGKSHSPEEMETHRRVFWAAFGKLHFHCPIIHGLSCINNNGQPWIRYNRSIKDAQLVYETWTTVFLCCS